MDFPFIYDGYNIKNINGFSREMNFESRSILNQYHTRMMLNKLIPMIEIKGLPKTITERFFNICTMYYGYSIMFKHKDNIYVSFGGLGGRLNYEYMPTKAIVANPYLGVNETFEIGKNCVVIPNDELYMGVMPMNEYYATQLVANDQTLNCNLIIMRLMNIIASADEDTKKSLDEMIIDLKNGKISTVMDDNIMIEALKQYPFTEGNGNNIVQLLEHRQYVRGSWWNEFGVQSNYNMKRETITSSENILNVDSLLPFADNMLNCRKRKEQEIKDMFGLDITFEFSSAWKKIRNEISLKETQMKVELEQVRSTALENNKGGDDNEDNDE